METYLGFATFENRLASLFEKAANIQVFRQIDHEICPVGRFSLPQGDLQAKVSTLLSHGVKHLICGAVSNCDQRYLKASGIIIHPWFRGSLEDVLAAWAADDLQRMIMPGCRGRCRAGNRNREQTCHRQNRPRSLS
ncbi:MAG: dinitrogenase iron-molybdenum cofactor biosynthesis protein [Deltaproteobacteria bacterium]|nr:dinitrogenase iron-molybdenum cofactor biosynthesis protein [Deltaproteobacteria bacterium]